MSETTEVVAETVETTEVGTAAPAIEADPVVERALEQGWLPKEEFVKAGRDESEWRPAKEFVERGELYKSIHSTKRELKQTQAALTALQRHHQYVFEKAKLQAIDELKKERRQAIRSEDPERVEEIEEAIEQHKQELVEAKQQVAQATQQLGPPPEFVEWKDKNVWYDTDEEMREFADAAGLIYINKNPRAAPQEVLKHIETKMRKQFPEKFGIRKAAPSAVAAVNRTSKSSKSVDTIELTEQERRVMKTFVDNGVMTEAEYIKELKKVGR